MEDVVRNAALFGGLAIAAGAAGWWRRGGWAVAAALAGGGMGAAVVLGVLPPSAWRTWASAWPAEPLLLLAGWLALAWGVRRVGGVGGWGPPGAGAFLGGAAFGGPPVALGLASGRTPREAARLGLLACAGGLCGPLGAAPLLLLQAPGLVAALAPLGVGLALVVGWGPRSACCAGGSPAPRPGPRLLLAGAVPCWCLAVLSGPAPGLLAALALTGAALLLDRDRTRRRSDPRGVAWLCATSALALLLVPAGTLDLLAAGLDGLRIELRELLAPSACLIGLGAVAVAGSVPVALAAALAFVSDPAALPVGLRAALGAGMAVGGMLAPLAIADPRALRAGLPRWALALGALSAWLALRQA